MDTNASRPDDLNPLEKRLAAWQPSTAGLAADAMLFAAGRASGRKTWLAWPVVTACLALAAVALGAWLAAERSERLALLRELQQRPPEPALVSTPDPALTPAPEAPAPDGYLALRREWEQHSGNDATAPAPGLAPRGPAYPEVPILRAWQPEGPL
jgi:hypothetical protein